MDAGHRGAAHQLFVAALADDARVRSLDLAQWRSVAAQLAGGAIAGLLGAAADAVQRGELSGDAPWLLALIERRVEDLRPIDDRDLRPSLEQQWAVVLATDVALWPFLAAPSGPAVLGHLQAWGDWNAVAKGGRRELGSALWALPDALHVTRTAVQAARQGVARRGATDADREELAGDLGRERGVQLGYELESEKRRGEWELFWRDGPPYRSRRQLQWSRRVVAEEVARRGGTPPPPAARGRWPGSQGRKVTARRAELRARLNAWPGDVAGLVAEHAERHGVSLTTAWRDVRAVRSA